MRPDHLSASVALVTTLLSPDHSAAINTLVACAAGAYASFAWGDKVEPRGRMWAIFFACIVMGWAFTTITAGIVGWLVPTLKLTNGFTAAMGAVISCLTRFWLPSLIGKISSGEWVNWVPFLKRGS